jgi:hypothetical protein
MPAVGTKTKKLNIPKRQKTKRNIDICAAFIKHTPVQIQSAGGVSS